MMRVAVFLFGACLSMPVLAQHASHGTHEASDMEASPAEIPSGSPPPEALEGPAHAADSLFDEQDMARAREQLRAEQGDVVSYLLLADRFETHIADGEDAYAWDIQGWYGGDIHRLWLKSEGEGVFGEGTEEVELQALYSRAVTPFFDVQAGVRHFIRPDDERFWLTAGLQGLMPYSFELEAAAFVSDDGDLTGRLQANYDLHITQRFVLQPRIEVNIAAQEIPELTIGSGLGSVETGLRLRYEIRREIAPYLGLSWERKLGDTGDLAVAAGDERRSRGLVAGIRFWF